MDFQAKTNTKWLWGISGFLMLTLSGCGMYPSKPGAWPKGFWGEILQGVSAVIDFFAKYLWNDYGLALLVVTVLVRLLVLPLMVKQIRTSKMMQQMQPQMQKIRSKYKGDNKKIQEETMKLYQQSGVNPLAGCFPMLIQLPILYALYGAIEGNILLNKSVFLGIFNLGHADHLYILPLLAAVTTFLSSKVMMMGNDSQQKMMLFIMPVFIFLIGSRFPAGLALYWIYSNVFTTVQTYFIRVRPNNREPSPANSK